MTKDQLADLVRGRLKPYAEGPVTEDRKAAIKACIEAYLANLDANWEVPPVTVTYDPDTKCLVASFPDPRPLIVVDLFIKDV